MPGLKTRKRIKKDNTANPVMMMTAEPSVFRSQERSDPSVESQSQSRRMENPALQLKRSRSARSFSDIALQRLSSHSLSGRSTAIQRDDDPNATTSSPGTTTSSLGTTTTSSPGTTTTSSPDTTTTETQNSSPSIPQDEVDKIVEAKTAHMPDADELTLDVGSVKQKASQLRQQRDQLTHNHPGMNSLFNTAIVQDAESDGGTPDLGLSRTRTTAMVDEQDALSVNRHDANRYDDADITTDNLADYVNQQNVVEADHEKATKNDRRAQIGQITSMTAPTLAGQTAVHVAGQSARLGGTITAGVQLALAPIDALFNARALTRSIIKAADLTKIANDLKASGHDPELVEAIAFAIRKKKGKAIARAITLATNLLTIGTATAVAAGAGLIALMSNPVGWGALTVLAAIGLAITSAVTLYYIGRWAWKKWKGTLGVLRRQMAKTIFQKLRAQDPTAQAVIKVLMGDETGAAMTETAQITESGALKNLERAKEELMSGGGDISLSANDRIRQVKKINDSIETIKASRQKKAEQVMPLREALFGNKSYDIQIADLKLKRDRALNAVQSDTSTASFPRGSKRNRLVRKVDTLDKSIKTLERKKAQDLRTYEWKLLPKMDRNAIKQIERKLKNW